MKGNSGFTLVEVLVVVMLLGIMAAFAMPSVLSANKNWENASKQIAGNFKLARAKAVSKTSVYKVKAISVTEFEVKSASSCDTPDPTVGSTWQPDFTFDVKMPKDTQLILPTYVDGTSKTNLLDWDICFDTKGAANKAIQITLQDTVTKNKQTVKVFTGGKVKIEEVPFTP
jgi:prepilin-type N-terminal cleavage/methylation domain-containing protein